MVGSTATSTSCKPFPGHLKLDPVEYLVKDTLEAFNVAKALRLLSWNDGMQLLSLLPLYRCPPPLDVAAYNDQKSWRHSASTAPAA